MPKTDATLAPTVATAIATNATEVRLGPASVKVFSVCIGLDSYRRLIERGRVSCIRIIRRWRLFCRWRLCDQVRRSRDHFVVRAPVAIHWRVLPNLHGAIYEDVFAF